MNKATLPEFLNSGDKSIIMMLDRAGFNKVGLCE